MNAHDHIGFSKSERCAGSFGRPGGKPQRRRPDYILDDAGQGPMRGQWFGAVILAAVIAACVLFADLIWALLP